MCSEELECSPVSSSTWNLESCKFKLQPKVFFLLLFIHQFLNILSRDLSYGKFKLYSVSGFLRNILVLKLQAGRGQGGGGQLEQLAGG